MSGTPTPPDAIPPIATAQPVDIIEGIERAYITDPADRLLVTAACIDSALTKFRLSPGVSVDFFISGIAQELAAASTCRLSYANSGNPLPLHPIILSAAAEMACIKKNEPVNLLAIRADDSRAVPVNPQSRRIPLTTDLQPYLNRVPMRERWWMVSLTRDQLAQLRREERELGLSASPTRSQSEPLRHAPDMYPHSRIRASSVEYPEVLGEDEEDESVEFDERDLELETPDSPSSNGGSVLVLDGAAKASAIEVLSKTPPRRRGKERAPRLNPHSCVRCNKLWLVCVAPEGGGRSKACEACKKAKIRCDPSSLRVPPLRVVRKAPRPASISPLQAAPPGPSTATDNAHPVDPNSMDVDHVPSVTISEDQSVEPEPPTIGFNEIAYGMANMEAELHEIRVLVLGMAQLMGLISAPSDDAVVTDLGTAFEQATGLVRAFRAAEAKNVSKAECLSINIIFLPSPRGLLDGMGRGRGAQLVPESDVLELEHRTTQTQRGIRGSERILRERAPKANSRDPPTTTNKRASRRDAIPMAFTPVIQQATPPPDSPHHQMHLNGPAPDPGDIDDCSPLDHAATDSSAPATNSGKTTQILFWKLRHRHCLGRQLGLMICLGHGGSPCPETVEGSRQAAWELAHQTPSSSQNDDPVLSPPTLNTIPQPPISSQELPPPDLFFAPDITVADGLSLRKRRQHDTTGNLAQTFVDTTGVHRLPVLHCICRSAKSYSMQLFDMGFLSATFHQIETVFSFAVLDDFLIDNLECKTTAQQFYAKLRTITNGMFPERVPTRYKQLLRAARQWRDLLSRKRNGFGFSPDHRPQDGDLAIFCPACPQPSKNLPPDWKERFRPGSIIRSFIMDGNFTAEHMRARTSEADVALSAGTTFMVEPLKNLPGMFLSKASMAEFANFGDSMAIERAYSSRPHLDVTGVGATACGHGFYVPNSVVDFQKGERLCNALQYDMEDIPQALVMYDIMCQYGVHLRKRVDKSPHLTIRPTLKLLVGIGLFHIHGHQDICLSRFSPSFIKGARQIDGEIIETVWAPLNLVSRSIRGMTLAHRQEILDSHMNYWNWKKLVNIVPAILLRFKRVTIGLPLAADVYTKLSTRFAGKVPEWLCQEAYAQNHRWEDNQVMDIYDTKTAKAPSRSEIHKTLAQTETSQHLGQGETAWLASGLKIQETQSALRRDVRNLGKHATMLEQTAIEDRRHKLQTSVDAFQHQADSMILKYSFSDNVILARSKDYAEFDDADNEDFGTSLPPVTLDSSDSDDDHMESNSVPTFVEDAEIFLPSSVGWDWCQKHGVESLAAKEAKLRRGQASDAIHRIRLALGLKSALFRTTVRAAKNQKKKKTRAWGDILNIDSSVREHARVYSIARDALSRLGLADEDREPLPQLRKEDLKVATIVLGSAQNGQRNKQMSWIWSFGNIQDHSLAWMDD
ncbi:hypothetical protein BC834DRAFT_1036787, partial [Gloeopeniophorella convolvens]